MGTIDDRLPYLGLLVAVIGVSFSAIFIRWSNADALAIAFYRQLMATMILAPLAWWKRDEIVSMDKSSRRMTLIGGLVLAIHFGLWTVSVQMTSVASAVFLVNIHPLIVGVASFIIWREGGRGAAAGIALGMTGMLVITIGDMAGSLEGNILAALGGCMTAIYLLIGRRIRLDHGLIGYIFLLFASSALFLFIMAIVTGAVLWPLPIREFMLFAALALVSSIMGHLLYNWCLGYVSAPLVSLSFLGEPIMTALLAIALLDEIPVAATVIGGALILVGIMLTVKVERSKVPVFDA